MLNRTTIGWILLASIFGFVIGGSVVWSSQAPSNYQTDTTNQRTKTEGDYKGAESQSLWIPIDSVGLYTLVLCVFTAILAIVSIFQGAMLIRANKTAKISADAAWTALGSERAWVMHRQFHCRGGSGTVDGVPARRALIVLVQMENFGRRPALEVDCQVWHKMIGMDDPIPHFDRVPQDADLRTGTVGPGVRFTSQQRVLGDADWDNLRNRNARLILYSAVSYLDGINRAETRISEVCVEVAVEGESHGPHGRTPVFSFSNRGSQNTVT